MYTYIYTGKTLREAKKSNLLYNSNGRVNANGLVEVKQIASGDTLYYSKSQFLKLFKLI